MTRNAAVGDLALATGLRLQEFTYLLTWEIPPLPPEPTTVPIPFPVPSRITKGKKFRTPWTSYEALARVHDCLELDRAATAEGTCWRPPRRWGEPLMVTEPDARSGMINEVRRSWASLVAVERRWSPRTEARACWHSRTAAARSAPGPRSSSAHPTGSGPASSPASRTFGATDGCRHTFSRRQPRGVLPGRLAQPAPRPGSGHRSGRPGPPARHGGLSQHSQPLRPGSAANGAGSRPTRVYQRGGPAPAGATRCSRSTTYR
jgi:hypothetical protein